MNENEKIAQLTESVQALTQAVASSEKRYQRLEGIFRWIGVGVVFLFATTLLTHFEWIDRSHANTNPANTSMPPVTCDTGCDQLMNMAMSSLTPEKFNTIMDGIHNAALMMNRMSKGATDESVQTMMEGIGSAAVLMTRLKQDSDVLRAYVLSNPPDSSPGMQQILTQSKVPTPSGLDALAASPAMYMQRAREALRVMANNLQTMAYSMGSTMGRMGSWMP